jgi:hypothetical protein
VIWYWDSNLEPDGNNLKPAKKHITSTVANHLHVHFCSHFGFVSSRTWGILFQADNCYQRQQIDTQCELKVISACLQEGLLCSFYLTNDAFDCTDLMATIWRWAL